MSDGTTAPTFIVQIDLDNRSGEDITVNGVGHNWGNFIDGSGEYLKSLFSYELAFDTVKISTARSNPVTSMAR
jgi:hypothetical protein